MADSSSNWAKVALLLIVIAALPMVSATKFITTLNGENISIGDSPLFIDNTNDQIGIGTNQPTHFFDLQFQDDVARTSSAASIFLNASPTADNATAIKNGLQVEIGTPIGETNDLGTLYGINTVATHSGTGDTDVKAIEGQAFVSNGTSNLASGIEGTAWALVPTTNTRGVVGSTLNFLTTVSDARGGMFSAVTAGGTTTDAYGVYIGDVVGSNEWGLYQSDASNNNYFAGDVGVATTGPDRKLDVLDASNPQFRITQSDGSVFTDFQTDSSGYLIINSTGDRVGIGMTPTNALSVNGDLNLAGEGIFLGAFGFTGDAATGYLGTNIYNAAGTPTQLDTGEPSWLTRFGGPETANDEFEILRIPAGGTFGGASTLFTIQDGGEVGINDPTPSAQLDVNGDVLFQGELIVHGSTGANEDRITLTTDGSSGVLQVHNGGNYGFMARGVNNAPEIGSFTTGELLIGGFDAQTGGTFSEMARFDLGVDRFGLNNTNPQNTLDVVGTMLVNETTNGAGIEVDGSGNVIITIGGG